MNLLRNLFSENDDMELRLNPAEDLHNCSMPGGKAYAKGRAEDTVNALDFTKLYCSDVARIRYLNKLVLSIEGFLA